MWFATKADIHRLQGEINIMNHTLTDVRAAQDKLKADVGLMHTALTKAVESQTATLADFKVALATLKPGEPLDQAAIDVLLAGAEEMDTNVGEMTTALNTMAEASTAADPGPPTPAQNAAGPTA